MSWVVGNEGHFTLIIDVSSYATLEHVYWVWCTQPSTKYAWRNFNLKGNRKSSKCCTTSTRPRHVWKVEGFGGYQQRPKKIEVLGWVYIRVQDQINIEIEQSCLPRQTIGLNEFTLKSEWKLSKIKGALMWRQFPTDHGGSNSRKYSTQSEKLNFKVGYNFEFKVRSI